MTPTDEHSGSIGVPDDGELLDSLRWFVRARGADWLQDPNISSVGVGHKISEGRATDEIALQFTVDRKVAPEALGSMDTRAIPETIDVDGVPVPTDVIERSYAPSFRIVPETRGPGSKLRQDPITPGASVGHLKVSAGTIGCIVYDRNDGTPLVLSNWHVLHGHAGALGDVVVQPGPHDDNRVERNRLGRLRRSYLGAAGDCAVATVEDRGVDHVIDGLGVVPEELGDPQLGDKVVKSGRTTGVTHGIVRRTDVLVRIGYGAAGEHAIGCFEIGTDPDRAPADGEISSGGDSGAAWMFTDDGGAPTTVLAGLHFAGESGTSPDEHALACLPQSVFEKLGLTLRPPAPEAVENAVGSGYAPGFLDVRIDLPVTGLSLRDDNVPFGNSDVIPYTHFSVALSRSRRFARWVAWNIDGGSLKRLPRKNLKFTKDARIPQEFQHGDELYRDNRLDRGHLARRADLLWAALPEAERANKDSFFFTNIAPQMDDFNQSSRNGVWGRLEDAVFEDVDVDGLRVSVFGGPVFQDDDRVYRDARIPREYWKIIVFVENGRLKSRGFVLTQNIDQLRALDLDEFRVYQVTVAEVEARTGVVFDNAMHEADTFAVPRAVAEREPLADVSEIQW